MSDCIQVNQHERVLELRMQRPDKKNALTGQMYAALAQAIRSADEDDAVRAVLISGSEDCFTAGNDVADFLSNPPKGDDAPVWAFLAAIATSRKPLLAAVEGLAVGIGTTLLMHCDLVYAGRSARLQLPFVRLGLCPEAASSLLLPALAGYQRASEALLLGKPFSADKGAEMGLINEVVEDGQALSRALAVAQELADLPPDALITSKGLLRQVNAPAIKRSMQIEADEFLRLLGGPEAREAVTAFMEKRQPDFSKF